MLFEWEDQENVQENIVEKLAMDAVSVCSSIELFPYRYEISRE